MNRLIDLVRNFICLINLSIFPTKTGFKRGLVFSLLGIASCLSVQDGAKADNEPLPTVEQIEAELNKAQQEFDQAKKIFNPWYSGPLLTGSGNTYPPGHLGVQPYLYVIDTYANFSSSGHSESAPTKMSVTPLLSLFTGITNYVDISLNVEWDWNQQSGQHGSGFGDISLGTSVALLKETPTIPALKISVSERFPVGRYENLSSAKLGLDGVGNGSYQTSIGLSGSKVVLWSIEHPMAFRGAMHFNYPTNVHVHGFNSYGGGFGTDGTVSPGKKLSLNFAFEYSFNQHWVFANDFLYTYKTKTTFKGTKGFNPDGSVASPGSPFGDNLSLAPAIEYNPSPDLNFVAGAWFSVWGRNTGNFAGAILSVYMGF